MLFSATFVPADKFGCFYALLFIFFMAFCSSAFADERAMGEKTGTITGAGAYFAWVIFDELKEEFEQVTGKKLQLYGKNSNLGMGCNAGIKVAQQHRHNNHTFGFVCCPLSQNELQQKKIKIYPIADESILILVNKNNPIDNLSTRQVREIFSGKIKNWKEVGGWEKPIVVVARTHCKKRPGHWKTILTSVDKFVKERINVGSASEMVNLVTKFQTAIGHTGATWMFDDKSNVKAVTINHVEPSADSLKNKRYPFYRTLSAVTVMNPAKDILKTIKQVQTGSSIKHITKKYNLLSLNKEK